MLLTLDLENSIEKKVKVILDNTGNKNILFEEFIEYQINQLKKGLINT